MSKTQLFFLFIFFLFGMEIAGAQSSSHSRVSPGDIVVDSFEEVPGRGLEIRTNPSRVRVFINGAERGITPFVIDSLPAGEHSIRLIRENYNDKEFTVTLFPTSKLIASIKMERPEGLVLISIFKADGSPQDIPFNPIVTVNTNFLSSALNLTGNMASITLPLGRHTIRVRAQGWEEVVTQITITEEITPVAIIMKPLI